MSVTRISVDEAARLWHEAPDDELGALAALARGAMTTALALDVPLQVDLAAGPNWLDVEEVSA